MERREFFKNMALISAGSVLFPRVMSQSGSEKASKRFLKGFIVSDAHFGWENDEQPAKEQQRDMMRKIMAKFPDLDLVIDTGDAHHNGKDRDKDRGNWTEYLANQAEGVPFFYVPGNHEITHANYNDTEKICNELGSLSARPYYSWDMYGIHFISMPELIRAVYISRELIEWVKLDLEINKDKTTILLSHNNIIGTTGPFEEGYRGLVNSEEIYDLMRAHPNVIAWMHGHNHNYEIVEKEGKLFVSNGRIGGFDPSKGKYGLGGIFFEVNEKGLMVKCYSAEFDKFLEEIDGEGFSKRLSLSTSFYPKAAPAYSYGKGCAVHGEKLPVYHHHLGCSNSSALFIGSVAGNNINEDPRIKYYMERRNKTEGQKQLMGYDVKGNKNEYIFMDPGIKILPDNPEKTVTITAQREGHSKYTYYRISPLNSYRVELETDAGPGGQTVLPTVKIWKNDGELLNTFTGNPWKLSAGIQQNSFSTGIVELDPASGTIYDSENSDALVNMSVEFEVSGLKNELLIKRIDIMQENKLDTSLGCGITYQDMKYTTGGNLLQNSFSEMKIPSPANEREVIEVIAAGRGLCNILIRNSCWDWQVRNASAYMDGETIVVNGLRNKWMQNNEIMIAPGIMSRKPFLYKTIQVESFRIIPYNRKRKSIQVNVLKTSSEDASLEIRSIKKPAEVIGCQSWNYYDSKIICAVLQGDEVKINFENVKTEHEGVEE